MYNNVGDMQDHQRVVYIAMKGRSGIILSNALYSYCDNTFEFCKSLLLKVKDINMSTVCLESVLWIAEVQY